MKWTRVLEKWPTWLMYVQRWAVCLVRHPFTGASQVGFVWSSSLAWIQPYSLLVVLSYFSFIPMCCYLLVLTLPCTFTQTQLKSLKLSRFQLQKVIIVYNLMLLVTKGRLRKHQRYLLALRKSLPWRKISSRGTMKQPFCTS